MKSFVGAVMAAVCAQPVLACGFCAVYVATEAQGNSGKGFYGGVAEQYTYFDTFQVDGHNRSNPDAEHLNSLISQVFGGYNFNNRFGLQLNLSIIYREYSAISEDPGGAKVHGSEFGPGDLLLLGHYRIYKKSTGTKH